MKHSLNAAGVRLIDQPAFLVGLVYPGAGGPGFALPGALRGLALRANPQFPAIDFIPVLERRI